MGTIPIPSIDTVDTCELHLNSIYADMYSHTSLRLTMQSTLINHDSVKYVYNFANPCVGDSESGDDCEAVMHFQFAFSVFRFNSSSFSNAG